jgi:hypothetical protein
MKTTRKLSEAMRNLEDTMTGFITCPLCGGIGHISHTGYADNTFYCRCMGLNEFQWGMIDKFYHSGLFGRGKLVEHDYPLKGKVIDVYDGNNITIETKKEFIRIRLLGVNSPDLNETGGPEAKEKLCGLVLGKDVTVHMNELDPIDMYGRTLGAVVVDSINVHERM